MTRAIIFDIERSSYVDGPGIRTTVFFKGCNLRCAWCHNPESQSHKAEMMVYKSKCTGCGKCKEKCPYGLDECRLCGKCTLYCPHDAREVCGKEYTADELLCEILKDKSLYETSGGGVTFSGGECMLQIDFLEEILKKCKENGIHTAIDTAGHIKYESFERVIPYTDLFLYDVKCIDPNKHKQYTGVDNELILENLKRLMQAKMALWVRIPVIPTVNDTEEEMIKIKELFLTHGRPQKIELLPYHAMGEHKYSALNKPLHKFDTPSQENLASLGKIFQ